MCAPSPAPSDVQDLLAGPGPVPNKIAIMQPYFLPYLGYFQLIKAVNAFVVYDNIKYTKKGWINRNRILLNGKDTLFTIPLANSSDFLPVNQKFIANDFEGKKEHILAKIQQAYRKAPYFNAIFPCLEAIFNFESHNLFDFIFYSLQMVVGLLHINTPLIVSSTLPVDPETKGNKKVLAICQSLEATTYINPIGGIGLYTGKEFKEHGINLYFHNMDVVPYRQAGNDFISHLSIIDVLMYNSPERVNEMLDQYKLLEPADIVITGNFSNK
jgi:hypothetical protein